MNTDRHFDCIIIGGGLGGLTLAINLSRNGIQTLVLEKEVYPFHKVCGEYISMESRPYLSDLGFPFSNIKVPHINQLLITAPNGSSIKAALQMGGFGISRFTLDAELCRLARNAGAEVLENCKVEDVVFSGDLFFVKTASGNFSAEVCCCCYGKRTNIDAKLKRAFIKKPASKLNNYIAVKYHIATDEPANLISLHNFKNGYCGISQIEDEKYCLCYLTTAANLKTCNNSIRDMERRILSCNPFLKSLFEKAKILYEAPLTISQISFDSKAPIENHMLMIGDAAGLITPLCGNGMSMAIHAGKIAAVQITNFLQQKISRTVMENNYHTEWTQTFNGRLRTGRILQKFFGKPVLTNLFITALKHAPNLTGKLISRTHGEIF